MTTIDLQPGVEEEMPLPFGVRAGSGALLPEFNVQALRAIGVDPAEVLDKAHPKPVLGAAASVKDPNTPAV